ncbi:MAG: glutamate ABC transporter permease [Rhizobiales bacterium 24-66-13]|uniref:amino acid ABC transporter permease n=1 Tax=Roseixanthobacter finlandensis TaxID=3119922 RepID=UPI000BCFF020|nr:MAG: glutamate ABC transporter permease [Rhizobiales bacterium 24-66-13]OZA92848.1 MAG: glutamate ABC transporter permease [Rhizobiales bacterium 39-66-18]HQS10725.1 amino acid ABC transporter permease [Xanthobacteraceae bacterium]HQS45117.1 amino acid ABC transporter permease [Xanthobacteraceae bacterium]
MDYHWNWAILWAPSPDGSGTYFDMLMGGLKWTIATSVCAWLMALVFGSLVGVARTLPFKWLVRLSDAYVELFRNIPLLVQLFLWFFVIPELLPHDWGTWVKQLRYGPFLTAVVGIGFYMSSRVAMQVSAGINTLPRGQRMAGTAIGLTTAQTYRYILLPMAYRIMLPPLTSEFLNTIKNTSVALTIGLMELTGSARAMQEFSFQVFEAFTAATVIYLLLNAVVTIGMRMLERRVSVPGFNAGK